MRRHRFRALSCRETGIRDRRGARDWILSTEQGRHVKQSSDLNDPRRQEQAERFGVHTGFHVADPDFRIFRLMDGGKIITNPVFSDLYVVAAIRIPFHFGVAQSFGGSAVLDATAGFKGFAKPARGILAAPLVGKSGGRCRRSREWSSTGSST